MTMEAPMAIRIPLRALEITLYFCISAMFWYAALGGQLPRKPETVVEVAR